MSNIVDILARLEAIEREFADLRRYLEISESKPVLLDLAVDVCTLQMDVERLQRRKELLEKVK